MEPKFVSRVLLINSPLKVLGVKQNILSTAVLSTHFNVKIPPFFDKTATTAASMLACLAADRLVVAYSCDPQSAAVTSCFHYS